MTLIDEQLAYLAGIFDSDASFFIGSNGKDKKGVRHYVPTIVFATTHLKQVSWVKNNLSKYTKSNIQKVKQTGLGTKDVYRFTVRGNGLYEFLKLIQPYLISKKEQCKYLIEYIELRKARPLKSQYGPKEFEIIKNVSKLNGKSRKNK